MSSFKLSSDFKNQLSKSLAQWAEQIYQATDSVIATPRYWDNWTTSNPFRDIIDSEDLRNSGKLTQVSKFKWNMTWSTAYIFYVYFGYTLADGRQIPDRKFIEVAFDENNYRDWLIKILIKAL